MTLLCCQLMVGGCAAVMTAAATHATAVAAVADVVPLVLMTGAIGYIGIAGVAGNEVDTHSAGIFGAFLQTALSGAERLAQEAMNSEQEGQVAAILTRSDSG